MTSVMVVDDSSVVRKVARRIFDGLAVQTVEAENGQEALALCATQMPDGILLDWNMPVMDGYAFLKELRRMTNGGRPRVVFCTTENDTAHIARAMHAGANDFMMKPFDRDTLIAKLNAVGLV